MNKYIKQFMDDNNLKEGEKFVLIAKETKCPIFDGLYFEDGILKKNGIECLQCWLAMVMNDEYDVEKVKKGRWSPNEHEPFFFVNQLGDIVHRNRIADKSKLPYLIERNLVFRTEEEAEDYKWFLDKVDEYKKPFENGEKNYFFYYDYEDDALYITFNIAEAHQGVIYFDSYDKTEAFIEEVGKDRIKKYMFGVYEQ